MYFVPQTAQLIFGGLNINNKYCSTFTFYVPWRKHCEKEKSDQMSAPKKERLAGQRQTQISFLGFNGNTPDCAAFFTARQKGNTFRKPKSSQIRLQLSSRS